MGRARLILSECVVLTLAGLAPAAAAQDFRNPSRVTSGSDLNRSGQVAARDRSLRTIIDTVVVGEIDVSTLRAALEALPRRPKRIEIIDDDEISVDLRKRVADMDAFSVVGSQTVFVRRQSRTLREAEFTGGHYTLMLGLVIWHEMAHTEGLDEAGARRREEALWREYIRNGRVDRSVGLEYLRELEARR